MVHRILKPIPKRLHRVFCLFMLLSWSALGNLGAHPHMSLESVLEFIYVDDSCKGIRVEWLFDSYFSAAIIGEHDIDGDGSFNTQEAKGVHDGAFINLRKYGYFIYLREGSARVNPTEVHDFVPSIRKDRLVYSFYIDLKDKGYGKDFSVAIFDSTYYCAVTYGDPPVRITQETGGAALPAWERNINREYPVYYDPIAISSDMSIHNEWKPGLETAYPEELRVFPQGETTGNQSPADIPIIETGNTALLEAQLSYRARIAAVLETFKENPNPNSLWLLLLGTFIYGLLHAAGPGHRKTVLFSLFLARQAAPWEPFAAGLLSASLHGATALAVLGVLSAISGRVASISSFNSTAQYLEGISLFILAWIGLFMVYKKFTALIRLHRRAASDTSLVDPHKGRNIYSVIALASLVPCPGVMMLLILSLYLELPLLGILGAVSMSMGMAATLTVTAYLAYFGREGLFRRLKDRSKLLGLFSEGLEIAAYLVLVLFALYGAWPFLISLLS